MYGELIVKCKNPGCAHETDVFRFHEHDLACSIDIKKVKEFYALKLKQAKDAMKKEVDELKWKHERKMSEMGREMDIEQDKLNDELTKIQLDLGEIGGKGWSLIKFWWSELLIE